MPVFPSEFSLLEALVGGRKETHMKLHSRNSSHPRSASKRCSVVDILWGMGGERFHGGDVELRARPLSFQGQLCHRPRRRVYV